jgi:hypothetical protein
VDLVSNKDLDAVAKKYSAQVKETALMEPGQPIPELGNAAEFDKKIFAMNKGEFGTSIQVDRGYVVPQVVDIVAAHPASLEESRDKVSADVKIEKAKQLAADKAKQIEELLKSGKDLRYSRDDGWRRDQNQRHADTKRVAARVRPDRRSR